MPSPDLRPYVDLTLLDVDEAMLFDAMIELLKGRLPGWAPSEADTEVVLLEAIALPVAELIRAVNRVPGAVLETLLRLFGLNRSTGTPATMSITVTAVNALGQTVPAGTRFQFTANPADGPVLIALDADLVIGAGDSTGTGDATAVFAGTGPNGTAIGTRLYAVDAAPVTGAVLASAPIGGTGPEDGAAFLARAVPVLGRLTDTLVLPAHFTEAALEETGVYRATTLNLYDADTDTADVTGHVTVAVAKAGGLLLDGTGKTRVHDHLAARALATLVLHVIDATITTVDLAVTIKAVDGEDPVGDVGIALAAYLNPDTWAWGDTVRRNDIIRVVGDVPGVDYVDEVYEADAVTPFVDLVLTGPANLAKAGTIQVDTV